MNRLYVGIGVLAGVVLCAALSFGGGSAGEGQTTIADHHAGLQKVMAELNLNR